MAINSAQYEKEQRLSILFGKAYYQNGTVYQGENRYCLTNANISEILKSFIPDYKEIVHSSLFTVVEEIGVLAEKEPNTIPFSEDDGS